MCCMVLLCVGMVLLWWLVSGCVRCLVFECVEEYSVLI